MMSSEKSGRFNEGNNVIPMMFDGVASNLRWVSRNENMHYVPKKRRKRGVVQPVVQYDLDGNVVKEYTNATEAARENGYRADVICWCCRGRLKTAYGYVWKRKNV